MSVKVQVVFYSMYGHIYRMAEAVAEGAREVEGSEISLYQVAELIPDEALQKSGAKAAREGFAKIPVARPEQLAEADAIIFGTPTRFGNMCAQMRNFLDQTGQLWMSGGLVGKIGSVFTSNRHAAWRAGDDDYQLSLDPSASRHGDRRGSVHRSAFDEHVGNHRRFAVRREYARGRRREATSERKRTCDCAVPGPACDADR